MTECLIRIHLTDFLPLKLVSILHNTCQKNQLKKKLLNEILMKWINWNQKAEKGKYKKS
jgi:predicted DNA-binding ArsR family transcriptional regulator